VRHEDRERFHELACDHDGQGGRETDSSRCEARISLTLEYRGILSPKVSRPPWADVRDGRGQLWDIKSPRSEQAIRHDIEARALKAGRPTPDYRPIAGVFRLDIEVQRVVDQQQLDFGVIVDLRRLTIEQARELVAAIMADPRVDPALVRFFPPDLSVFESET
jgi:hypothetical protein